MRAGAGAGAVDVRFGARCDGPRTHAHAHAHAHRCWQSTHTRDVTEDYADGAARHAGLLASHAQLLALMKRADKARALRVLYRA